MENTSNNNPNNNENIFSSVGYNNETATPSQLVMEDDEDWEEWDGTSPFWIHCVAGSMAGVVEHTAVYPLDTVRTHIQVACSACNANNTTTAMAARAITQRNSPSASLLRSKAVVTGAPSNTPTPTKLPIGMWQTIRHLMSEPSVSALTSSTSSSLSSADALRPHSQGQFHDGLIQTIRGWTRLWRGVQTMFIGCIPAHALYFSSYEAVKVAGGVGPDGTVTPLISSAAGGAAVIAHDMIMTPLDTIKQRMQLGHYQSLRLAFKAILHTEGSAALYRSFPVTLATNVPYGMIMVSTHEQMKHWLSTTTATTFFSAPLQNDIGSDLLTRQYTTQTVVVASSVAGFVASAITTPLDRIKTALQTQALLPASCVSASSDSSALPKHCPKLRYKNWYEAAMWIYRHEGPTGFVRGMLPRVLSHTPAVAISWTTYETAKHYLLCSVSR